jgi:hypothetical protein
VGGVDAVVGAPGDRRPAPWALRGPLREPEQRPQRALQAPLRPRLVVVAAPTRSPLFTDVVEGQFSELRAEGVLGSARQAEGGGIISLARTGSTR